MLATFMEFVQDNPGEATLCLFLGLLASVCLAACLAAKGNE